ncbi:vWA domain-containing protein [Limosilactobacillus caccae]|uniref:vWA domain-containing protein n=1 Tax=Limosilactobacillus caccae TaxID=1926284 RepID=UPI0009710AC9|nr:VWA-like domain-containing protein [Limosilactobacillus caccae]
MSLVGLLHRLQKQLGKGQAVLPKQVLTTAIVQVLQQNRLLGEVLLQLPRQLAPNLPSVMGLAWQDDRLVLMVNPTRLEKMRADELPDLLEHEALHVVWSHPLRYADYRHPQLARIATDVAVNQYLAQAPTGTVTLSQLQKLLRKKIPARLDSQDYLRLLENLTPQEQERLKQAGISLTAGKPGTAAKPGPHKPTDTHRGWGAVTGKNSNQTLRLAKLNQLLKHAWHETPQRDRGLLPGEMVHQLAQRQRPAQVDWQAILRRQVGLLARGQRESHARFNRRQPYRMDLPGKVTRLVTAVNVFVDNSGSVSDEELSTALATIEKLVRREHLPLTLYTFDAKVTAREQVRPGKAIAFQRHGGGGTSFQCIFDYLKQHQVSRSGTLTVIITDGWGEQTLRDYHYHNVCWLLSTAADQLSVKDAPGRVLEMKGENR